MQNKSTNKVLKVDVLSKLLVASLDLLVLSFPLVTTVIKKVTLCSFHFIDQQSLSNLNQLAVTSLCWSTMVFISYKPSLVYRHLLFARGFPTVLSGDIVMLRQPYGEIGMSYFYTPAGSIVFVWPRYREFISDMFSGILSSLSQLFLSFWQPCIPCWCWFSLDSFSLALSSFWFLNKNFNGKSVKIIENQKSSLLISVMGNINTEEIRLSSPLIKRSARRQNLMKSAKNTWSMPERSAALMPSSFASCHEFAETRGYVQFDGLLVIVVRLSG